MECECIREKLGFYLDGTLDEHTLEVVEAHLAQCKECRQELAAMKMLIDTAGQEEMLEPPVELRKKILQAIANEERETQPLAKVSNRLSFIDWLRSCGLPAKLRWAAGGALAVCAMMLIMTGTPHEPVQKQAVRPTPKPAQSLYEKAQPQPKAAVIAESEPSVTAQAQSTGTQVPHYARRHTSIRRDVVATRPIKAAAIHPKNNHVIVPSGKNDGENQADTESQATEAEAAQTDSSAQVAANPEPVNERPIVVRVASAPVFNNDKIHEMMQQAKMQAEMRKSRDSHAVINLMSTRF